MNIRYFWPLMIITLVIGGAVILVNWLLNRRDQLREEEENVELGESLAREGME